MKKRFNLFSESWQIFIHVSLISIIMMCGYKEDTNNGSYCKGPR